MNSELIGFYRHYRSGAMYEVTEIRTNKTTMSDGQKVVCYHAVISGTKFTRSLLEFTEQIRYNGVTVSRYIKVNKENEPVDVSGPVPLAKTGEWLHKNLQNGKKDQQGGN